MQVTEAAAKFLYSRKSITEARVALELAQKEHEKALTAMVELFGGGSALTEAQVEAIALVVAPTPAPVPIPAAPPEPAADPTPEPEPQALTLRGRVEGILREDGLTALLGVEATKFLQDFSTSKIDGRSAEGRAMAARVAEILHLPPPQRPGPKPEKPRALDAVAKVLQEANTAMRPKEVMDALIARDWLPKSNDPYTYISFILSQNKDYFERDPSKPRGYYRFLRAPSPEIPPSAAEIEKILSAGELKTRDIFSKLGTRWSREWTKSKNGTLLDILKSFPQMFVRSTKAEEVAIKGIYAPAYWSLRPVMADDDANPFDDEALDDEALDDDSLLG